MVDAQPADLARARSALLDGGVGVVPTDTVYGLAAALDSPAGVDRLYELKGRPRDQPCQVLVYSPRVLEQVLASADEVVAAASSRLLPGPVTCIIDDTEGRFAAAAGGSPGSVGVRAPVVGPVLAGLDLPLVATSANHPGGAEPAKVPSVPEDLRVMVDFVLDAGALPGVASSVVDLRRAATDGVAQVLREGPGLMVIAAALAVEGITLDRESCGPAALE
ncbi:MAG: Sua5/YciO/YrdC/YwlC family protein [Thermoleophilia bacterium]|nr:Sua5/YciO/YrdC/YwlC family protein [Thermoleophilia bacterium]